MPDDCGNGPRKSGLQFDLVEGVAIAFEKPRLLPIEPEDVVAIRRLEDAHERLRMEAVGHDRQLSNCSLEAVDLEQVGSRKEGEPVERMVPEASILGQVVERA